MQRNRLDTNPAFSARKLKLGTFQTNLNSGCVMSGPRRPAGDHLAEYRRRSRKLADEMEFEALVPVARWRGFGGAHRSAGTGFRSLHLGRWHCRRRRRTPAWSRPRTSRSIIRLLPPSNRPSIDHIANGRYTLNVVMRLELAGNGNVRRRAARARGPLRLRRGMARPSSSGCGRRTTTSTTTASFYRINKGYLQPKPIQTPYPAIMNAGSSERGRHFACRNCDLVFTNSAQRRFRQR